MNLEHRQTTFKGTGSRDGLELSWYA